MTGQFLNDGMVSGISADVAVNVAASMVTGKFFGYGTDTDSDSLPFAKEALTFMVIAINDTFRLPVGTFLLMALKAVERGSLVQQCLSKLHSVGIVTASLRLECSILNYYCCMQQILIIV